MSETFPTTFTKEQKVWRPAPCCTRIEQGVVILATPADRDGEPVVYYSARFPTEPTLLEQTGEEKFFGTQAGALTALACEAQAKGDQARREADKWEQISRLALAHAEETEAPPVTDPRELQNDGDPIKAAALPPEVLDPSLQGGSA